MYIWELDHWPAYRFNQKSAELWTNKALAASQKILGAMAVVPTSLGIEAKLDLLISAAIETSAIEVIRYVVAKARFWDGLDTDALNARQMKLIRKMLGQDTPSFENEINAAKYQNVTRCSKATATRDLQNLVAQGVLAPVHSKGRYARYRLVVSGFTEPSFIHLE
jgi:hypothetical protein